MIEESFEDGYISKQDAGYFNKRWSIFLYKQFLILMEDFKKDHEINFAKLKAIFPEDLEVLDIADYLGEQQFSHIRKRILDLGNDAIRNFENDIRKIV